VCDHVLSNANIKSHQEPVFQVKPATILIPVGFSYSVLGSFTVHGTKNGSLFLIKAGSGFHYLCRIFYFFIV
jgi:hypothetical protein